MKAASDKRQGLTGRLAPSNKQSRGNRTYNGKLRRLSRKVRRSASGNKQAHASRRAFLGRLVLLRQHHLRRMVRIGGQPHGACQQFQTMQDVINDTIAAISQDGDNLISLQAETNIPESMGPIE